MKKSHVKHEFLFPNKALCISSSFRKFYLKLDITYHIFVGNGKYVLVILDNKVQFDDLGSDVNSGSKPGRYYDLFDLQ